MIVRLISFSILRRSSSSGASTNHLVRRVLPCLFCKRKKRIIVVMVLEPQNLKCLKVFPMRSSALSSNSVHLVTTNQTGFSECNLSLSRSFGGRDHRAMGSFRSVLCNDSRAVVAVAAFAASESLQSPLSLQSPQYSLTGRLCVYVEADKLEPRVASVARVRRHCQYICICVPSFYMSERIYARGHPVT